MDYFTKLKNTKVKRFNVKENEEMLIDIFNKRDYLFEEASKLENVEQIKIGYKNYKEISNIYNGKGASFLSDELKVKAKLYEAAKNTYINNNLMLVFKLIEKFKYDPELYLDLNQEALMAFSRSFNSYKTTENAMFLTHVTNNIRYAIASYMPTNRIVRISDGVKYCINRIREIENTSDYKVVTKDIVKNIYPDLRTEDIETALTFRHDVDCVDDAANDIEYASMKYEDKVQEDMDSEKLTEEIKAMIFKREDFNIKEQQILFMRFGIGLPDSYTLNEVGQQFGLTRERIRQIEKKCLTKLYKKHNDKLKHFF